MTDTETIGEDGRNAAEAENESPALPAAQADPHCGEAEPDEAKDRPSGMAPPPAPEPSEEGAPTPAVPIPDSRLCALEAVLFMAAEPLDPKELAEILEVTPEELEALANELSTLYLSRGLQLTRIAGGYQVATRPEYGRFVARLHEPARFRLSRAALETLAIVAYRQPVTRPEIDAIRGVNSDSPLDTLLQYELVCEAGRKDAPGRPVLYRTTEGFLGHFGLNSIDDLPRLDSIPADVPENAALTESPASQGEEPSQEADLTGPQEQSAE